MTGHITTSRLQRFRVRALPVGELTSIVEHLDVCIACTQHFTEMLRSARGAEPLKFTLAPEFQMRHEHVDYEQLVRLAHETMDDSEREMLDAHLKICASCREDVPSFVELKEQIDRENESTVYPSAENPKLKKLPWFSGWRDLRWNPAYAAAVVLIGIAVVIGVALLLKRRAANLEASQSRQPRIVGPAKETLTPETQAVTVQPTPAPAPSQQIPSTAPSPALKVQNQERLKPGESANAVVALNDEQGTVTIDKAGNLAGLDEISQRTRQEIGEALLAGNIKAPATRDQLEGGPIVLRGPDNGTKFRLLSPGRTVIFSNRPSFEWEKLAGATSYRVSVGDLKGHEIANSEELPADQTRWTPTTSLKRGDIYVWEVEATFEGKKIVSPGPSAAQMKFKVLSTSSAEELEQLMKIRSHLALGVFYAREGMLAEAHLQFQILVRDNPTSQQANKLLRQIQSWQRH
jgi:hypothetical protein